MLYREFGGIRLSAIPLCGSRVLSAHAEPASLTTNGRRQLRREADEFRRYAGAIFAVLDPA